MSAPPSWAIRGTRYLSPIVLLLLIAQYLLGLWTNVYAPPSGFTSNSSSPSLDWHYNFGFILGLLGIVLMVVAGLSRRLILIGLAVLTFVGILVAGLAGGAFVGSTPNPPSASVVMGAMFLLAFVTTLVLVVMTWTDDSPRPASPSTASG